MSFVSIVVPVYNKGPFLQECINSILSQSHANFELILVDDGSTDNSLFIIKEQALRDRRIHFYHQENQGASSARNKGIREAKGIYVTFIDADDVVHQDYLKTLIYEQEQCGWDRLVIGIYIQYENRKLYHPESWHPSNKEDIAINNFLLLYKNYLLRQVCNILFVRHFLDKYKLEFDETVFCGEDTLFNMSYIEKVNLKGFRFINNRHYYYRQESPDSLTKKHFLWDEIGENKILIKMEKMTALFESSEYDLELWDLIFTQAIIRKMIFDMRTKNQRSFYEKIKSNNKLIKSEKVAKRIRRHMNEIRFSRIKYILFSTNNYLFFHVFFESFLVIRSLVSRFRRYFRKS